ncbi:unnamed protein product, partial [Heterosigma akashiwo]
GSSNATTAAPTPANWTSNATTAAPTSLSTTPAPTSYEYGAVYGNCSRPEGIVLYDGPACRNAMVELAYEIIYDPLDSTIVGVYADMVVTDIPETNTTRGGYDYEVVEQCYGATFTPDNATFSPSQANGNLIERGRSGNPGYVDGYPVYVGNLVEDGDGAEVVRAPRA